MLGVRSSRGGPIVSHLLFVNDSILFNKATKASGLRIRSIMVVHEKASGLQINLRKSKISFSPNVQSSVRRDILGLFGINDSSSQDKYLGLPSMVGRNKRVLFMILRRESGRKYGGRRIVIFRSEGRRSS